MKPKIIEVTAVGISQVKLLYRLNDSLIDAGYEVHALCAPDDYIKDIRKEIEYHPVNISRSIHPESNLQSVIEMIKIFKAVKPDIIHVHTPVAAILARIAAKAAGTGQVVYTAHGFYFHEGMNRFKYQLVYQIEKYFCRYYTDYLFTQSREDYHLAVDNQFIEKEKALHISNGIDLDLKFNINTLDKEKLHALKETLRIKEGDVVFSFLGRMVKEKGILELLHAFSIVHNEYPETVLICMGDTLPSDRDQTTRDAVKAFETHPAVIFTGQVKHPEYYYALSEVYVLPSYREGMPRSIIEAMAMKNAIIATNIRGSREEVIHGLNGFLAKTKSVTELAGYMKYLLEHPERRWEMQEASYTRAHNEYDEADVVNRQVEVFNRLTGG